MMVVPFTEMESEVWSGDKGSAMVVLILYVLRYPSYQVESLIHKPEYLGGSQKRPGK